MLALNTPLSSATDFHNSPPHHQEECTSCSNPVRHQVSYTLDCKHIFCESCIKHMLATDPNLIFCPRCLQVTDLSLTGNQRQLVVSDDRSLLPLQKLKLEMEFETLKNPKSKKSHQHQIPTYHLRIRIGKLELISGKLLFHIPFFFCFLLLCVCLDYGLEEDVVVQVEIGREKEWTKFVYNMSDDENCSSLMHVHSPSCDGLRVLIASSNKNVPKQKKKNGTPLISLRSDVASSPLPSSPNFKREKQKNWQSPFFQTPKKRSAVSSSTSLPSILVQLLQL